MIAESTGCANCGAHVADQYCGACGQPHARRLRFRDLASTALAELASLDTAFLRTFKGLTRNPGRVAREYVDGRRVHYLNPLKYALFSVTVYVVLAHLFDAQVGPPGQRGSERPNFDTIISLLPYLMLIALLPAAALQRLLFRSSGDHVAECYVFGLFTYGHVSWILTPLVLSGIYLMPGGVYVVHGLRLGFWLWATTGFYRSRSIGVLLKGAVAFLIFLLITMICAILAHVVLYWWNGWKG